MAKIKTVYVCANCGNKAAKWVGQCSVCGEWNTFKEEIEQKNTGISYKSSKIKIAAKPKLIKDITYEKEQRINTLNAEFNRVLGGGLVPGSLVLIGGEPGIGKSTLALQIAVRLKKYTTLYVSGEESLQQIKLRAERIADEYNNCYILSETRIENILRISEELNPDIIVIDSVQTVHTERSDSSPGSVSQIRECTVEILKYAKENGKPVILIGHINKEGSLAGPKILEHIVDTVLQFEGDRNHIYRILRASKNRFGSTSELGIFEMQSNGLREVTNPSELLLSRNEESVSGVSVSATVEGARPFLIEIQALVSTAAYGNPQRSSTGFDIRRLNMLLAVLEKRAGFRLAQKDVFLNVAGGIKIDDPAGDLAVICSVLSSDINIALPEDTCFAGEVGLSGEIRPVTRIEQRISEAEKLGFKRIYISRYNTKNIDTAKYKIKIFGASKVEEVFRSLFK
ncbi:MAG: DNA repair protein RadA [Chlorobi bacterium]|nr:DNA repair protein RadA [Chlorobiota bacterium]